MTYLFSGSGSGTMGGSAFTSQSFLVSITGDASGVAFSDLLLTIGIFGLPGTITIGSGPAISFTEALVVFGSTTSGAVGFGNLVQGNLIAGVVAAPSGVDLVSNFGPASAANGDLDQFVDVATSGGLLTFSAMSDFTFQSIATTVPEPAAPVLVVVSMAGLALARRRRGTPAR